MRIMGLDPGDARIGVAVSDPLGITAQAVGVIQRTEIGKDVARVTELCGQYGVEMIVVGLPLEMSGRTGPRAEAAMAFAARLREALAVPVTTWDERLSTVSAERVLLQADLSRAKRRAVIDEVSAAIILQNFLDSRRFRGRE